MARVAPVALTWLLGLGACGSDGEPAPAGAGPWQSGTGGASGCQENVPCSCDDGRRGFGDSCTPEACDCSACPAYAPQPRTFEACGGEPFGTWRLDDTDTSSTTMDVYVLLLVPP